VIRVPRLLATCARVDREVAKDRRESAYARRPKRLGAPRDLMAFVPWLSPELVSPRWLEPLTSALDGARGGGARVLVSVPPRHGKSTTIHHWIAQMVAADPRMRILYCSYDLEFAQENTRQIRSLVLRCGVTLGARDVAEEFRTAAGGCVRAAGIQAPPTGEGYHVVIVDDPIRKLADALSVATRNRIGNGFSADLFSRQQPSGGAGKTSFVVVATRWHEDDLVGRLASKGWNVINLPAILPNGQPLAPELWTLDDLAEFRALSSYTWDALYMGDPRPREGRLFHDPVFVESVPTTGRRTMGVDLSHSAKRRSDRHALCVLLEAPEQPGIYYVADFAARRCPLTDTIDPVTGRVLERGFVHDLSARPYRAAMYTGREEDLVLSMLSSLKGARAHVEARRAVLDKRTRAQPCAAAWNAGRIRVPVNAAWADEFVSHVIGFTGEEHGVDEEVDTMAAAFDMISEGSGAGVTPLSTSTRGQRLDIGVRKRWT
jgi:predicted phage terminase large subunit-like protein